MIIFIVLNNVCVSSSYIARRPPGVLGLSTERASHIFVDKLDYPQGSSDREEEEQKKDLRWRIGTVHGATSRLSTHIQDVHLPTTGKKAFNDGFDNITTSSLR